MNLQVELGGSGKNSKWSKCLKLVLELEMFGIFSVMLYRMAGYALETLI